MICRRVASCNRKDAVNNKRKTGCCAGGVTIFWRTSAEDVQRCWGEEIVIHHWLLGRVLVKQLCRSSTEEKSSWWHEKLQNWIEWNNALFSQTFQIKWTFHFMITFKNINLLVLHFFHKKCHPRVQSSLPLDDRQFVIRNFAADSDVPS